MNEFDKLQIEYASLNGEFIGFCKGILWWEIPDELKLRITEQIKRLESNYLKQQS